ncbi:MAG: EAL domain-containing protein [Sphingopyxis sp.]|jgi:diguanylate cyclase (GGDEF)-like protein|nr:EAL domain-containing protein [Sphingopyxis sp.]
MPINAEWTVPVSVSTNDRDRSVLQRARLDDHSQTTASSMAGNLVNAACTIAVLTMYDAAGFVLLTSGAVVLAALLLWRWELSRQIRLHCTDPGSTSAVSERSIMLTAGLLGAVWGLVALWMFVSDNRDLAVFGGIIGAGMMSAGAITYRTIPAAARAYVFSTALMGGVGLCMVGTNAALMALGLLACYCFVLHSTISANSRRFDLSVQRERDLIRSSETIQLLLNDLTEQGSDWLIEIDHKGRMVAPCSQLAEACRRPVETLDGMPFGHLFDESEARSHMKRLFMAGHVVRRHILSLSVDGETRWWVVSARPSKDSHIAYRGVVTDITAQRHAEEKVSYLAHYDGLTDLPNRFLFNERLYRMLHRGSQSAAVMYVDLDHFKSVNDTLGHSVGDRLLQAVARKLEDIVGKTGMVSRFGGDEFAILLPPRRINSADRLAKKIVHALAEPVSLGDHDVVVGASIGIAIAPKDADTAEALLRKADLALYAAKAKGRGQALPFESGMDDAAQARRQIEMDLRSAIPQAQLRLHYQPLIDSGSGDTIGYEALIRWEHPDHGVIMPDTFIPVAEDTGLIIPIGEWAIRQALDDAAHWPAHVGVAINLSPLQMRSPTLVSTVISALANSGVAADRVTLEITESVLMQDSDANIQTLHKLRSFGIQIALDDFGTGYSSLNYLRSFPFSKIKIDRCFIAEIDQRDDCRAIVRSVVDLAASLGMTTIAEGVERTDQAEALRDQGCHELQGFLYSKALPVDQLSDLRSDRDTHRLRAAG